ncbi:dihydroorotate oxidase [Hyphomicrobium sp. LHD-15]|uniref:dihydroorotate oxidase n=1 Tax=Hyphomicrobium sp. LHD-15 TaxID=3072142 RepID=UPI00280F1462|nr:dihydroorotate oxidase [Hyphomicrobium sp. LHD-15]MDQ8698261.1 dihydroorotate oxidase [Hyphomicrobium sp. LHD-15]
MRARGKRRNHPGGQISWSTAAGSVANRSVSVMGLAFANPLGLAAGVDRTGELVPSLCSHGFGHVEVGTITQETRLAGSLGRSMSGTIVGANIGSALPGLSEQVIEDYTTTLRQVVGLSDYVVANLSAPALHRDGDMPGIEKLVKRLSAVRDVLSAVVGRRVPLLLKLAAGSHGTNFPAAIMAARVSGLDGIVLVSNCLSRIGAISTYLDGLVVISVGDVRSADDVRARINAGAALVQVHSAYANGGSARIRRILKELTPTTRYP